MSRLQNGNDPGSPNVFRFNLTGLIVFSLCLIAGASFISIKIFGSRQNLASGPKPEMPASADIDRFTSARKGPWGELLTREISLECPIEYLSDQVKTPHPPVWTFRGMNAAQVKSFFLDNGLAPQAAEQALASGRVSAQGTNTVLQPSDEFVFSLSPETRQRLYLAMRGMEVSPFIDSPFYYPRDTINLVYRDTRAHPDDLALFKQLVYGSQNAWRFSDYSTLMLKIPTLPRRIAISASISRQAAILARLWIRPDTDVEKVAAYWGHMPNVRFIDIRPRLDALSDLSQGESLSLMYLLPPFARERLYTFPLPPAAGAPVPDCHWTTFNFCNEKPDDRFFDAQQCTRHIDEDFYTITQPTVYGDVVAFMNNKAQMIHSAVYLADDLVFTKNGKNHRMPWIIMRIPDLQTLYSDAKIYYLRRKTD